MKKDGKLKGKDLINIGIYAAIYCVIMTAVAMLGFIPIMMPMLCVLVPLLGGIPYMLFITKVEKFAKENSSMTTNLMRTSPFSFELVNEGTNKGVAVLKVAELLGIKQEHTAAIGDYFNDYEMLKAVGLPACCGQAPDGMKKIAKLVTCHCNKGAVADLIEYIIKNYSK